MQGWNLGLPLKVVFSELQICSHLVNTNSQISTVQSSYPALSYPVKSHLATLPVPVTRPNSFPFCTRTSSTPRREFRSSPFEFRCSPFEFRVSSLTPLSTAFTPNLFLSPLSTAFTQITRGVPLKEENNERHSAQHHHRTCLPASLPKRPLPACRQASPENTASPATLSTFKMNTCKSVSKQRTLSPFRMNTYAKTGGEGVSDDLNLRHQTMSASLRRPIAVLLMARRLIMYPPRSVRGFQP